MKFSCYKQDLSDALNFVTKATAVKPATPITSGIFLHAEDSMLELQANNFSIGIIARIPVNVEVAGETVVSGKRFQEFVRNMPDDTITFSNEDNANSLSAESGGACVELLTMAPADFPKVKAPQTDKSFKIRSTALRDLIRRTIFAVAKDDSRPIFTGVNFDIKGDKISLVATNTHRLALASDNLSTPCDDCSFVVPAETLRGILARLNPNDVDNSVTINYSTRFLTFTFDNVFVNSRLIEGQFPPYGKVIPASSDTHVTVDSAEFKNALEFVSLISKENEYKAVKFSFGNDGVEISSNSPQVGDAAKSVEAQVDGADVSIAFNSNYILDVMRTIDSKIVKIALNGKYSPAAFTEPDNPNYVYVATPVRA